jgi:hypothetical protein
MKNLRRLGATFALTCALGIHAFAGEPCAPPAPGQIESPPCASTQITPDNSANPAQLETPVASNTESKFSVAELGIDLMLSALSIF